MQKFILLYLLIVNAVGFALMLYDKKIAKRRGFRIAEKNLFSVAAVGGSMGCILGMYIARHKTKHKSFTLGMPAILLAQLLLVALYYFM